MAGLKNGTKINTVITGQEVEILDLLGEGGQGFVYKVNCGGQVKALKWYKPDRSAHHFQVQIYRMYSYQSHLSELQ